MSILSFGPAALVAAAANVLCFGVPLVVTGLFVDLDVLSLLVVLAVCFPLYALVLWLAPDVLMLDVLRALVRRRTSTSEKDGSRTTDQDELDPEAFPEA